jgi:hypothetical protein
MVDPRAGRTAEEKRRALDRRALLLPDSTAAMAGAVVAGLQNTLGPAEAPVFASLDATAALWMNLLEWIISILLR